MCCFESKERVWWVSIITEYTIRHLFTIFGEERVWWVSVITEYTICHLFTIFVKLRFTRVYCRIP